MKNSAIDIILANLVNRMYFKTIETFVYKECNSSFIAGKDIEKDILNYSVLESVDSYELWNELYQNLSDFKFDRYSIEFVDIFDEVKKLSKSEIDKFTLKNIEDTSAQLIRLFLFNDNSLFNNKDSFPENIIFVYDLLEEYDFEHSFYNSLCEKIYEESPTQLLKLYNIFQLNYDEQYRIIIKYSNLLQLIDLRRGISREYNDKVIEMHHNNEFMELL
jgi:hypothetical protein